MSDPIRDKYGFIDWNANGWPEPNAWAETDGYTTKTMPTDIFDEWLRLCDDQLYEWENE